VDGRLEPARSTARSRDGVCVPCQWASKRGESRSDAEANVQLASKPQDTQEPTRDRLLHLIQQGQFASQAEAARALPGLRQALHALGALVRRSVSALPGGCAARQYGDRLSTLWVHSDHEAKFDQGAEDGALQAVSKQDASGAV
jgi:hypothetical protein